jgi:Tfp pilus assembly protein FimT
MVVAILGIVAALAAPRYAGALHRYRADVAAARIAADLSLARGRARTASATTTVAFDLSANKYQLVGERDARNRPTGDYTVDLAAEPYFASISSVSFGGSATLSFNGYGVPSSHGFVEVRVGPTTRRVSIDADTGSASIQ